jgi:hypothetical protein
MSCSKLFHHCLKINFIYSHGYGYFRGFSQWQVMEILIYTSIASKFKLCELLTQLQKSCFKSTIQHYQSNFVADYSIIPNITSIILQDIILTCLDGWSVFLRFVIISSCCDSFNRLQLLPEDDKLFKENLKKYCS